MNADELKNMLELHGKWLRNEVGGVRANLTGANLTGANLIGANLTDADLTDADLTGADLTGAKLRWDNLRRANLTGANLTGANLTDADLTDADLTWADLTGANLRWANLTGANLRWANLTDADLTGADLTGAILPPAPVVPDLHAKVAEAVGDGSGLRMADWHCGTKHCRAGWAIVLAGEAGARLEEKFGPAVAGTLIYHASTGMVPDFYATDEVALADIRECAGL